jgi:hypothetical protein
MSTFERKLKVTKTDAYELDVGSWANGEAVIIDGITDAAGFTSVVASEVSGSVISVLLNGVSVGRAEVHFEYSTATRSDCNVAYVNVIADC